MGCHHVIVFFLLPTRVAVFETAKFNTTDFNIAFLSKCRYTMIRQMAEDLEIRTRTLIVWVGYSLRYCIPPQLVCSALNKSIAHHKSGSTGARLTYRGSHSSNRKVRFSECIYRRWSSGRLSRADISCHCKRISNWNKCWKHDKNKNQQITCNWMRTIPKI